MRVFVFCSALMYPSAAKERVLQQSLAHIALVVRDYDEAIAFYVGKLGFTLVADEYQPEQDKRWVLVARPARRPTAPRILLARAATPEQAAFIGDQAGGRVFLFLRTDDFDRDHAAMTAKGIVFVRPPGDGALRQGRGVPRSLRQSLGSGAVRMIALRRSRPDDGPRAVEIWRDAVDATHHFLTPEDRVAIDLLVQDFLPKTDLWLAVDEADRPIGFMIARDGRMEGLFVDPAHHGHGVGRALVAQALAESPVLTTDVNEQNPAALAFYEHLGFVRTGRSETDDYGRPYPLIHLRLG